MSKSESEIVWGLRGRKMRVFLFNVTKGEKEREGENIFFFEQIQPVALFFLLLFIFFLFFSN